MIRDTIESNTINACTILYCDLKEYPTISRIEDDWQEKPDAMRSNCCTTHVLARKWGHMYNIQQSYHNEHTHFCREMCNIVNTRFLRPLGDIMEITTKSP